MSNINSTIATLAVAAIAVTATGAMLMWQPNALAPSALAQSAAAKAASSSDSTKAADPTWAASATGRVEPIGGEVRIVSPVGGLIKEVIVVAKDRMFAGDLMVRLDDGDQLARIAAAQAETLVRRRERDEEKTEKPSGLALDRRNAEDTVEASERELFEARQNFDSILSQRKSGTISTEIVNLRQAVAQKKSALEEARRQLARIEAKKAQSGTVAAKTPSVSSEWENGFAPCVGINP